MNDMLVEVFERQVQLRKRYLQHYDRHAVQNKQDQPGFGRPVDTGEVRLLALALVVEMGELMQKLNWKPWKRTSMIVSQAEVKDELADVMHFYVELCVVLGFSAGDMYRAYMDKADVNENRQQGGY